jgi:hypothetical protein
MAQPMKPKLGMYNKDSKEIGISFHSNLGFYLPYYVVTDLAKNPET